MCRWFNSALGHHSRPHAQRGTWVQIKFNGAKTIDQVLCATRRHRIAESASWRSTGATQRSAAAAALHAALPQRANFCERLGVRLRAGLLLRALLPADAGECFAQVGFDAAGVAKGLVQYRFHAASCPWHGAPQPPPPPYTQDAFLRI